MSTLSFGFVFILMIACFSANTSPTDQKYGKFSIRTKRDALPKYETIQYPNTLYQSLPPHSTDEIAKAKLKRSLQSIQAVKFSPITDAVRRVRNRIRDFSMRWTPESRTGNRYRPQTFSIRINVPIASFLDRLIGKYIRRQYYKMRQRYFHAVRNYTASTHGYQNSHYDYVENRNQNQYGSRSSYHQPYNGQNYRQSGYRYGQNRNYDQYENRNYGQRQDYNQDQSNIPNQDDKMTYDDDNDQELPSNRQTRASQDQKWFTEYYTHLNKGYNKMLERWYTNLTQHGQNMTHEQRRGICSHYYANREERAKLGVLGEESPILKKLYDEVITTKSNIVKRQIITKNSAKESSVTENITTREQLLKERERISKKYSHWDRTSFLPAKDLPVITDFDFETGYYYPPKKHYSQEHEEEKQT